MPSRSYEQYCPVATALDVLGERWTLLVVRELLFGPRRYTDLQRALPGVSPNLLADRLRSLEDAGLVSRQELDPPAARTVYALTPDGRRARDVIGALARFGMSHLAPVDGATPVKPAMAVHGALTPHLDRDAAAGVDDHYRLVVGGRPFDLAVRGGGLAEPAPGSSPHLVLECDPALLVAARQGRADLDEAAADGRLRVSGSRAALRRFLRVFDLRRRVRPAP